MSKVNDYVMTVTVCVRVSEYTDVRALRAITPHSSVEVYTLDAKYAMLWRYIQVGNSVLSHGGNSDSSSAQLLHYTDKIIDIIVQVESQSY